MRYRLTYRVEREYEPGEGRITEAEGWAGFSQRTVIVTVPDDLAGERLYERLETEATERRIWAIFERGRR